MPPARNEPQLDSVYYRVKAYWEILRPFALPIVAFSLPIVTALFTLDFQSSSPNPAVRVRDALERVPTEPSFYVILAVLLGSWLAWRSYLYSELSDSFRNDKRGGLKQHNWWVFCRLRERAFRLRSMSGLFFGFIVLFLFSGAYVTLFILPQIQVSDRVLIRQARDEATFVERFKDDFRAMVSGRYWLRAVQATTGPGRDRIFVDGRPPYRVMFPTWRGRRQSSTVGKNIILLRKDSSVLVTNSAGKKWRRGVFPDSPRPNNDGSANAAFLEGLRQGILWDGSGNVFFTTDRGLRWSKLKSPFGPDNPVVSRYYSQTQSSVVLFGRSGTALVFAPNTTWKHYPESRKPVRFARGAVTSDGRHVVALRGDGSVVLLDRNKATELGRHPRLRDKERVVRVTVCKDVKHALLIGELGTVLSAEIAEKTSWSKVELPLGPSPSTGTFERDPVDADHLVAGAFSTDCKNGWVLSQLGQLFVTDDFGKEWDKKQLVAPSSQGITRSRAFLHSGAVVLYAVTNSTQDRALLVTYDGRVFVLTAYGKTWTQADLGWPEGETVTTAAFTARSEHALLAGDRGTVVVVGPNGERLHRGKVGLKLGELIVGASLSEDTRQGLLVGSGGTVLARVAEGSWETTTWDRETDAPPFALMVQTEPDQDVTGVALTNSGSIHLLAEHSDLAQWRDLLRRAELDNALLKNHLLEDSRIYQEVNAFLTTIQSAPTDKKTQTELSKDRNSWFGDILDDLTAMRIVTLTVLFFLVHLLIRVYQYNTRLAGFCESRADAILLAETFSLGNEVPFDDLVRALAPDGYDFRPMPRSTWTWPPTRNS